MADWPPNVAGKATQAAVFGVYHPTKGRSAEMLWTGQFPDLQPALYWAAKKEIEAVRKGKWIMASRVVWQHDLAPEKAVEVAVKQMAPQVDLALRGVASDSEEIDIGTGPLRMVDPNEAADRYVEITSPDREDPIASFSVPKDEPIFDRPDLPLSHPPETRWAPDDPRARCRPPQ